ncbi:MULTISPECIES: hypothetical protein [unclassified Serratia (in: enterobacteria)]|uniref:hypothetical protein n=1 Tax=unclassified Serratia (in: enterobacteria) TaxID=2647522 RepID=UPI0015F354AA|nr:MULTISPECIES: hypothetical protein [unclassified Serratia (in: enterobacteria)]
MTNYDLIHFLIADGGFYIRDEHIAMLQKKFPDEGITPERISNLRFSLTSSPYVKCEITFVKANVRALKVLSVDPLYQRYARKKPRGAIAKLTDSYLLSEPPEVVRRIQLMQLFNQLLAPVTHQRAY